MDIAFWSATKLLRALRAKKIGALELLDLYAARIARHDRGFPAFHAREPLGAHDRGERPAAAGDDADVVGGDFRDVLPPRH